MCLKSSVKINLDDAADTSVTREEIISLFSGDFNRRQREIDEGELAKSVTFISTRRVRIIEALGAKLHLQTPTTLNAYKVHNATSEAQAAIGT